MMLHEMINKTVHELSAQMLAQAGIHGEAAVAATRKIKIEHPVKHDHGEYSTNAAMQLVKLLKRSPLLIAEQLKDELLKRDEIRAAFGKIEAVPPGYINFFVEWSHWAAQDYTLPAIADPGDGKVLIEHTSINPNKSAHIGHLRNSCIGDTLARMLEKTGHNVEVHNYIDDLGNQLADTVVGLTHTPNNGNYTRFGDFCWDTYAAVNKAYKEEPELLQERTRVLHELEEGKSNTAWLGFITAEKIVREHLEEMEQFGIHYDVLVWESSIMREGFWTQAFEQLCNTTAFRMETEGKLAGCWVLKQNGDEDTNLDAGDGPLDYQGDKVLVRSNGILTYTAKDIAYHLWKFGLLGKSFSYVKFSDGVWSTQARGVRKKFGHASAVINVIDQRQQYPQMMVKQALLSLGYEKEAEKLQHVSYGVVSLSPATATGLGIDTSDGKGAYPMSGRQGIGIKVNDFLDEMEEMIETKRPRKGGLSSRAIAAASIRYYLLRFHLQTEVVFDLEQATEVTGNTGVYLLYAYARAHRILVNAKLDGLSLSEAVDIDFNELEDAELELIRGLVYWQETAVAAVKALAPNELCLYLYELSAMFNHLYATCPILKADGNKRDLRLWLTARYERTMRDGLDMLGLPAPKKM